MAHGRDDYAQLEESRSKLLLSPVPQGMSAATEVLKRLTLWESSASEPSCSAPRSSPCSGNVQASGAKQADLLIPLLVANGRDAPQPSAPTGRPPQALSRPCSPLTNRRTYGGLKSSFRPLNTACPPHCDPNLAPPPAPPESTWDRPFSGLHYAAITAPGPHWHSP